MADKINRLRAGFLVAACLLAVFGFQVLPSTSNVALAATSIGTEEGSALVCTLQGSSMVGLYQPMSDGLSSPAGQARF
jgi:hypothetical protein